MKYVAWAAFYEGTSDMLYLDVLLPRVIRDLIAREGTDIVEVPDVPVVRLGAAGRAVDKVAIEACSFRDALDVVFIHGDTGGRGVERGIADRTDAYCGAMAARCDWQAEHCITVTPRHETEAWLLTDGEAITGALGYSGEPSEIGLPADPRSAERLADPKAVLADAIAQVAGRRRGVRTDAVFPAVAQRQRIDLLRRSGSFQAFEDRLRTSLRSLGCVR